MLRYLSHHEINEKLWNDCVAASAERIVYAFSWYLNTVCQKWDAVVEEADGKYVSVFPLPLNKRLGQTGVLQPYYTQQLGLFTTPQSRHKSIDDYLVLIPAKYRNVYLQLNTQNDFKLNAEKYKVRERFTYVLNLNLTYEQLFRQYSTNQKRNLKKARHSDQQVQPLADIEQLVNLFKDAKGRELREVKEKHYRLLVKLYDVLHQNKAAEILQVVNQQNKIVAAALFMFYDNKIIFLFPASSKEGRQTSAMTLLLDSVIRKYAGSNRILDFEGSMVPSVAKFYANFGATPVSYVSLARQYTPWYLLWKKATSSS